MDTKDSSIGPGFTKSHVAAAMRRLLDEHIGQDVPDEYDKLVSSAIGLLEYDTSISIWTMLKIASLLECALVIATYYAAGSPMGKQVYIDEESNKDLSP